jgi:gliding motility-associated lipoprotein GldH
MNTMLIQKILLLNVLLICATGCVNNVYKKWDKTSFSGYIWEKDKEIQFEPVIEDIERNYTIILGLRHIWGIRLHVLPVQVTISSPSGNVITELYSITILDSRGKETASCSGSFCDIEVEVENNFRFVEKGKHIFRVKQDSSAEKLGGIMEFGLIIR